MSGLRTLQRLAGALDVSLDNAALDRFARYRELLLEWNQRVNLTRVTDPEEIEIKLFADSLALYPAIAAFRETRGAGTALRLVDIGTGAGFPGLPLKIVDPALDLALIEATGKKVAFVEAASAALGLPGVQAVHGRAEELAHQSTYRARFDIVTARAVARLPTLLEYCLPFLRPNGLGLFPKGRDAQLEANDAATAFETLRAQLLSVEPVPLPELAGTTLIQVQQVGTIPAQYPRRAGLPAKRPL